MFSQKCQELVRASQTKVVIVDVAFNKAALDYQKKLMAKHECSRSVCPINLRSTNENKYMKPTRCKGCLTCVGSLLYHILCINEHIESCLSILNDNRQGLEFKEACFSHLKNYRKELKEALIELYFTGFDY